MKRSEINNIIEDTIAYLNAQNFYLPKWGYWTHDTWSLNKDICLKIFESKLGWDVTDSGGDFSRDGLVLFTIRNGDLRDTTRPYCEKIIVMQDGQVVPYHYHKEKTEDIINRSKTRLGIRLGNACENGGFLEDDIEILIDGIVHVVKAREEVVLEAGESITLFPHCYHSFYPIEGNVLIGEVSKVNNDYTDNFFLEEVVRFPIIEEDCDIRYPLVNDYNNYIAGE